ECNGAIVASLSYPALFAAIGTTYGAGDGSTTFGLPDLRGEFLRGVDDGRGVDPSRAFGSAQGFAVQSHTHTVTTYSSMQPQSGSSTPCWYGTATGTSGATGGSETRPTNVALMPVIKY